MNRSLRAVLYGLLVLLGTLGVLGTYLRGSSTPSIPGGSQRELRTVDLQEIERQWQEGRLSDREAMYYRPLP